MRDILIPVDGKVQCTDGQAGFVSTVIVDPVRQEITHLVVQTGPETDHMVPLDRVDRTDDDTVYLRCTLAELEDMPAFTETHYVRAEHPDYSLYQGGAYQSPYVTIVQKDYVPVEEEQVPPGELAMNRGTKISASDGRVGELEEFIIDARTGKVSHFILRKGHLWGKREITIPMSAIDRVEGDTVYLKLDKRAVEDLPSVKVKRHYRE
jgi:sporulation protein YlmC with PRC-barrel domain